MNLEDRIKRRLLMEHPDLDHSFDERFPEWLMTDVESEHMELDEVVHLAVLEAEDAANPLAATAVVRKDAVTEIAPPDVEALLAAFNRPQEDQ